MRNDTVVPHYVSRWFMVDSDDMSPAVIKKAGRCSLHRRRGFICKAAAALRLLHGRGMFRNGKHENHVEKFHMRAFHFLRVAGVSTSRG